jgi:hypothetical protein
VCGALLCATSSAHAVNYFVKNCLDGVPAPKGSFRHAVELANANPGSDIVSFLDIPATGCDITPVAPVVVTDALWIQANYKLRLTTDAQLDGATLFRFESGHSNLYGVDMFGGPTQRGIYVGSEASLTVHLSRVFGFEDPTGANDPPHVWGGLGGGILANGDLSVSYSYVQWCSADYGGGIAFLPTDPNLNAFTFNGSIAERNHAYADGGAMFVAGVADATNFFNVRRSNIIDNDAGGSGGALAAAGGELDVRVSTFTGNKAKGIGGAIYMTWQGEIDAIFNTFVDNHCFGDYGHEIATDADIDVSLNSNILGYSFTWNGGPAMACWLQQAPVWSVNNLAQESSCLVGTGNYVAADMHLTGPALYIPAGEAPPNAFLWLFGLDAQSLAVDHGDAALCGPNFTAEFDERLYGRNGVCDIGAFERNGIGP